MIGATLALIGVLAFHTSPAPLSLPAGPEAGATRGPASPASPGSAPPSRAAPHPDPARRPAGRRRGADGRRARSQLQLRRVVSQGHRLGDKILHVGIASLDDGGNFRSQSIDQQAIPILEHEVMQAQSASIQGVSGASYTSAGFRQSLQAALHTLGFP